MRRYLAVIFVIILVISCRGFLPNPAQPTTTYTQPAPTSTETSLPPSLTPTFTPSPTIVPPTATSTPSPTITPVPVGETFTVLYHPDDMLYVGDLVSLEVISPPGLSLQDANLNIQVDPPNGPSIGPVAFGAWGIEGRKEATLLWVWDTHGYTAGAHAINFSINPQGYQWVEQVTLLPDSDLPAQLADAQWSETKTACCTVFYITDTASDRDLSTLTGLIDEQARISIDQMDASFTQPITITVLPRLLGHGGFTSSEISVSYLDRNYAANSWSMVVHHEMIHAIDGHLGGEFRPSLFVEGLAVYMAGGHYKPEPLMPRAAALLDGYLNLYIPLKTLADDFYASQHEIGYLEGASLIQYMVDTYGWSAFSSFYRDMHSKQGESQSDSIDAALQVHFSLTFDQLEQDFLAALRLEPDTAQWVDDVRLTVSYYDTMRRYQQLLDPSAYFRTAWLLDNKIMRERHIVADYLRHPHAPANLALETLFITASQQISSQRYGQARATLADITSVLDAYEHGTADPFSASLIASDYLSIATYLQQQGYEAQRISLSANTAEVTVTTTAGLELLELRLGRTGGEWVTLP